MLCQFCSDSNCVCFLCYKCNTYICNSCIDNHLCEYNDHKVAADPTSDQSDQSDSGVDSPFSENGTFENSNANDLTPIQTTCNCHHLLLTLFCFTCHKLMCNDCRHDHCGHVIVPIDAKLNMSRTMQLIGFQQLQDLYASIYNTLKVTNNLATEQDGSLQHIKKHFDIVLSEIDNVEKEIDEVTARNDKTLNDCVDRIAMSVAPFLKIAHDLFREVNDNIHDNNFEVCNVNIIKIHNIMEEIEVPADGDVEQVHVKLAMNLEQLKEAITNFGEIVIESV